MIALVASASLSRVTKTCRPQGSKGKGSVLEIAPPPPVDFPRASIMLRVVCSRVFVFAVGLVGHPLRGLQCARLCIALIGAMGTLSLVTVADPELWAFAPDSSLACGLCIVKSLHRRCRARIVDM